MPMAIQTRDEYQKVIDVTWFVDDKSEEELVYVYRSFSKGCACKSNAMNAGFRVFYPSHRCTLCVA